MSQDYGEMRIEQAKFYLPSVRVYYYPGSSSQENIRVFLSEEKLIVSDETLDFKELDGTDYYILTDVSLSIGNDYFTGIQQAVLDFQNGMQEQDTMTLLSFGDTVTVLEDKVSRTADIRRSVEELSNRDQNTHLFEALDCTAKLADCEERALRRTVAIVITDGEDCSTNERTKSEAQERLQEAGIPLYAMAVKETASGAENAFVEEFSDFVRGTQGKLFLFGKEEASECIQGLQTYLQSIQVLNLQTSSNRIHSMMQPLTLTAEGVGSKSLQVCPRYSQKDEEAPIAAAEQTGEKEVKILFSEPVQNAEKMSSYQVHCNGDILPVYAVSYKEENEEYTALLTFQNSLQGGEYQIHFQNVTDNSIEENPLTEDISLFLETAQTESEEMTETEAVTEKQENRSDGASAFIYAFIGAGLLALILFVAAWLKKRKKPEEAENEDIRFLEHPLNLSVQNEDGCKDIQVLVKERLVVGRSSACDLSLIDKLLSRQHFAIQKDSGDFYVEDLGTTNGTIVNGIRITSRCRLKNGDVIQAGSLYITVTW